MPEGDNTAAHNFDYLACTFDSIIAEWKKNFEVIKNWDVSFHDDGEHYGDVTVYKSRQKAIINPPRKKEGVIVDIDAYAAIKMLRIILRATTNKTEAATARDLFNLMKTQQNKTKHFCQMASMESPFNGLEWDETTNDSDPEFSEK
jgi:hypothetical protein